jgi:hypothetical protein
MEEIRRQLIDGLSMFIPLFIGFQPSRVVLDFVTIHSISSHFYRKLAVSHQKMVLSE